MSEDPSGWRTKVDPAMLARYRASGEWAGITIAERLRALAARSPDAVLFVDDTGSLTVAETLAQASSLAMALRGMGLAAGDVVSFQLPNWREAALIELACCLGRFVCNPIVPIYRDAEVGFMLVDARSRVLFLPEQFRGFDYRAMVGRLLPDCPDLKHVLFVRGSACALSPLLCGQWDDVDTLADPDPAHVKLILYTSGTTSAPKGVLHTHETIDAEVRAFIRHLGLGAGDTLLMPSTLCHITGYLYGIQLPITLGATAVLMERWDAARAADLIDRHGIAFTIGATPFLQELTQFAAEHDRRLPSLRLFPCGGAPVPPSAIRAADRAFENCVAFRVFGSTEAPTVALGVVDATQADLRAETEGIIVNHEVRLVQPYGEESLPGMEGEIVTRGPEVCVGYATWEQNAAFDGDGFFHTGDLGRLDSSGCLTVTGRAKDIIVRGGENISAKEVEDAIHGHPAVREVAVVAMPHARLGETCCAFVALHDGAELDMAALREAMTRSGLAVQKWPERLELLPHLPMTASGKVKKNLLRELAGPAC